MSSENIFPDNFLIGCASASYQIEGAWNADGKFLKRRGDGTGGKTLM